LLPTGFDGRFHTFAVSDVSWIASPGGSDRLLTGSGTYRIGGELALQQRLELDLLIDGQPLQRFDSGLVPANRATFPAITVAVSINDMVCFDTVVAIDAAPVPLGEIQRYRLAGSSTFQQGCGLTADSACDCPLGPALPMRGSFRLVPLQRGPLFDEFAVIDVRWQGLATVPPAPRRVIRVRGSGFYRVGGEFAVEQHLSLALVIGGQSPLALDSGVVLGGGEFPARIDVPVITDSNCFDRRIDLHARQGPPFARWWRAPQR
jgi:hypothetical protein